MQIDMEGSGIAMTYTVHQPSPNRGSHPNDHDDIFPEQLSELIKELDQRQREDVEIEEEAFQKKKQQNHNKTGTALFGLIAVSMCGIGFLLLNGYWLHRYAGQGVLQVIVAFVAPIGAVLLLLRWQKLRMEHRELYGNAVNTITPYIPMHRAIPSHLRSNFERWEDRFLGSKSPSIQLLYCVQSILKSTEYELDNVATRMQELQDGNYSVPKHLQHLSEQLDRRVEELQQASARVETYRALVKTTFQQYYTQLDPLAQKLKNYELVQGVNQTLGEGADILAHVEAVLKDDMEALHRCVRNINACYKEVVEHTDMETVLNATRDADAEKTYGLLEDAMRSCMLELPPVPDLLSLEPPISQAVLTA
ncbi:MAG: hypothetical protein ABIG71_04800 [Candidatus Uhrbacteria bacterium]